MAGQQSTNKSVRKNRDGLFSKKIVRQVLFVVNLFTIAVLLVSYLTGGTGLDTLIKEWFSFFKVEVLALSGITVTKTTANALVTFAEARKNIDNKNENDFENYG